MSINNTNTSLELHRNHLNAFALWDDVYLANEANSQGQTALYYTSIAKIAWISLMFFTAIITLALGTLNAYTLPASLYVIIHIHQPIMEATYHNWNNAAADARSKKETYVEILNAYQKLQKLTDRALRDHVERLTGKPPQENGELFLPLLAQYTFFKQQNEQSEEKLQKLFIKILHEESLNAPESILHLKRETFFHLEEQFCIQKIELAFLLHVLAHPFDKKKLLAYGSFNQKDFIPFCSRQFFNRNSSPVFFHSEKKGNLTRSEVKDLSPQEIYERLFKMS